MHRIALIEDVGQVPALEMWITENDPGMAKTLVIAFTPEARAVLLEKRIPHEDTGRYFGRTGHEKTLRHSSRAMELIRNHVQIKDRFGNTEGYQHYILFNLRFFLHYLLFTAEVIHQAVTMNRAGELVVPEISGKCRNQSNYATYPGQLPKVAASYCEGNGLVYRKLAILPVENVQEAKQHLSPFRSRIAPWMHTVMCDFYRRLSSGKSKILVSDRSYRMGVFIKKLMREDQKMCPAYLSGRSRLTEVLRGVMGISAFNYYLPDKLPEKKTRQWQQEVASFLRQMAAFFSRESVKLEFNNTAIDPMLSDFSLNTFKDQLLQLYCKACALDQIFKKTKPDLVLSQHAYGQTYLMGETALRYGVPSVLISHGSHTPPRSEFSRLEWEEHGKSLMNRVYRFQAVQTPLAEQYLQKMPGQLNSWRTGPVLFAGKPIVSKNIRENRGATLPGVRQKHILMHAGTAKTTRDLRLFVYETNDEYIENLNHLITEVEKLEDTYLVVRFRPNWQLDEDTFKKLLRPGNNYGVYATGVFQDYLAVTDLLISYSSTTIEEALLNQVPVLQYDPQGKYCHVDGLKLGGEMPCAPETCYFVDHQEALGPGLRWIIRNHLEKNTGLDLDWERYRFSSSSIIPMRECLKPFVQ